MKIPRRTPVSSSINEHNARTGLTPRGEDSGTEPIKAPEHVPTAKTRPRSLRAAVGSKMTGVGGGRINCEDVRKFSM